MSILIHETELLVVYDGDCRICTRFAQAAAQQSDLMTHVVALPSQEIFEFSATDLPLLRAEVGSLGVAGMLAGEDFHAYLVVVEVRRGGGPVRYRAAQAAARVSSLLPQPWPLLARIMHTYLGAKLGDRVYRVVARNRHRLGCGDSCSITNH